MTQEQKEIYKEWKSLVNMTQSELKKFYDSEEGKEAGLSASKAKSLGIDSMTNDFHKVIKNKMAKGGLIEQDFYHVSNKEIKKVKPYFHIGSKNSAEKRSEDYNYGNDALYYKVKFVKQPKAKDVSDRLANLYASYYSGIDISKEATKEEMHSIKSIKRLGFNALKYKNEIEGDYSYLIINPELIKIENIMEKGGEVQEYFTIDFYNVSAHTDTSSDQKYGGYSYDDAKSDFDSIDYTDVSDVSGGYALLEKRTETYKFVGDLEDGETIDDYPIEDYYDDYSMYEFVSEGDFETIEEKTISPPNESSDELLKEVERYMNSKYGSYKYNVISVYDDEDNRVGCVQVRVADHSENVSNIDRYLKCDYSLSVVIANLDKTKGRFLTSVYERRSNEDEEYFSSDDSFEDIISFIEDWIEDKSEELRYVKMEKGGEVAAKKGKPKAKYQYEEEVYYNNLPNTIKGRWYEKGKGWFYNLQIIGGGKVGFQIDFGYVPEEEISSKQNRHNQLKGGLGDNMTPEKLAEKHGVSVGEINKAIKKGIKVEMEHTDSKEKATEIVYDHLTESPFYYNELDKMESKLESENEIHDAIKGLEMILPTLYGSEKSDMQDAISGLKILLGNKVKYEMGGAIESEEDEIMRSQFGSKQF